MLKIHRFKVFKKTTKFKRYNRGLTRFIINRKKYILRKKRTSLQFQFNLSVCWTKYYFFLRNYNRFLQALSTLNITLTLSSKLFYKKVVNKNALSITQLPQPSPFTFTSIKKKLFFNKGLFKKDFIIFGKVLFKNTHVGFINANNTNLTSVSEFKMGLITDFKNYYPFKTNLNVKSWRLTLLSLHNSSLRLSLLLTKELRKILVLTMLMTIRKF